MADSPSRTVTQRRDASAASSECPVKTMTSEQLFGHGREIWIDHDGCRYRLRITKRNKLILQK
jgi:hemin uptake protein HemP